MPGLAEVKINDTIEIQRQKLNRTINEVNAIDPDASSGVEVVETEGQLPPIATAKSNLFIVKKHSSIGGPCLAAIVNNTYRYTIIKNDVINGTTFIYVNSEQLASNVIQNKIVYLDSNGVWQLADSTNETKRPTAVVGPFNSIIFNGVVRFTNITFEIGKVYYCNNVGGLTDQVTKYMVGRAISTNMLYIHITREFDQVQADWNIEDENNVGFIKNKPGLVSKKASGFVPQLPDEDTVSKYLRQDGTWSELPNNLLKTGDAMIGTLTDVLASQVRNIQILSEEQSTGIDGTLYAILEDY